MKNKGYLWPIIIGFLFIGLFVVTMLYYYRSSITSSKIEYGLAAPTSTFDIPVDVY